MVAILDNIKQQGVFEHDDQINFFLILTNIYENMHIELELEEEGGEGEYLNAGQDIEESFLETLGGKMVIRHKKNYISKGSIPLERILSADEVPSKPTTKIGPFEVQY